MVGIRAEVGISIREAYEQRWALGWDKNLTKLVIDDNFKMF